MGKEPNHTTRNPGPLWCIKYFLVEAVLRDDFYWSVPRIIPISLFTVHNFLVAELAVIAGVQGGVQGGRQRGRRLEHGEKLLGLLQVKQYKTPYYTYIKRTIVSDREMENISRGPTFGDFFTIRTERSIRGVQNRQHSSSVNIQKITLTPRPYLCSELIL
jgi:hypothetical protein